VVGKPTSPYYQPGQVDLNNIYDEEELEGQEDELADEGRLAKANACPPRQQQGDGNNGSWEYAGTNKATTETVGTWLLGTEIVLHRRPHVFR
jgi:hypothetical protein